MSKVRIIKSIDEAVLLGNDILRSAEITKQNIISIALGTNAVNLMYDLKFKEVGFEPLEKKPINLMEQLNQMFTYLVSIEAVIYLMKIYPEMPFTLHLGNIPGHDIESADNTVIAETFSVTSPTSNSKLKQDVRRLHSNVDALHKYAFYYSYVDCPASVENMKSLYPDVKIIKVTLDRYLK